MPDFEALKQYSEDTRMLVNKLEKRMISGLDKVDGSLEKIDGNFHELEKGLFRRLPTWATVVISLLTAMLSAAVTALLKQGVQGG